MLNGESPGVPVSSPRVEKPSTCKASVDPSDVRYQKVKASGVPSQCEMDF